MDAQGVNHSVGVRPISTHIDKLKSDFLLDDYVWPSKLCSDLKSKKPKKNRRRKHRRKKKLSKTKSDIDLRSSKIPNDGRPILITNQNIYDWGFLLNIIQPTWVHFQSGWLFVPIAILNNGESYAMVATPNSGTILYPIVINCLH